MVINAKDNRVIQNKKSLQLIINYIKKTIVNFKYKDMKIICFVYKTDKLSGLKKKKNITFSRYFIKWRVKGISDSVREYGK